MSKKRESIIILAGIILMTLLLLVPSLIKNDFAPKTTIFYFLISAIIIIVSVFTKKIIAKMLDSKVEIVFWQLSRYWITKASYLRQPLPIGLILPLLLSFITAGITKFLGFFQFSMTALPSKVTKKYGAKRFSTVTEWDAGLVAFYSMVVVIILTIISAILSKNYNALFPFKEMAKYSFYFNLCNLIPFGQLDGMKIFMSSRPLYIFSLIVLALSAFFAF